MAQKTVVINHDNFIKGLTACTLPDVGVPYAVSEYTHDGHNTAVWLYPAQVDGKQCENPEKALRGEITHNTKTVSLYLGRGTKFFELCESVFDKYGRYAMPTRYYSPKKEIGLRMDRSTFLDMMRDCIAIIQSGTKDAVKDATGKTEVKTA